ncbi:unnamed protein product, partial [Rotaria magnacalcarata]
CTTQNIIYVLTCPCKQFDYIGETSVSLPQRLTYHRKHGNRIIKEFLLGKKLTNYINEDVIKSYETLVKDRMKLYQHLCYCSVAMQHFLDENSDYWSFIPQRLTVYEEQEQEREIKFVDHHQYQFANDVPVPTNTNYHFTTEQKLNIEEFFQQKKYLTPSNSHFDFYQASIIAVCKYQYLFCLFHLIMNNFTFNNTDWFDDIFDVVIIDDDNDDDKKEVERTILEDYYEDFDIHFKPDADDDDEENFEVNENVQEEEEEVLSQKLIELSTEGQKRPVTTPTSSQEENSRKKRICLSKVVDIKQPSNQITSYLETMDEMFHHTMVSSMIPRSDLQAIIEYKHQMKVIQLNLQRWTRYYEVGVEEQLWSIEVKEKLSIKTSDEKQYAIYIQ